jgi:copper oxidase (laccase) domain-containing protein
MGWKPTDKQLASKVIDEMKRVYESSPDDISVFIGPGIHKESYVFKNPAQKELPGWANFSTDLPSGETQIDILGHIQEQVLRSGVLQKNIEINSIDTARSTEYFSHYRTVRVGEVEGRFATIVGIV